MFRLYTNAIKTALMAALIFMSSTALSVVEGVAQPTEMTISVIYGPEKPQAKVWLRFKQLVDQRLPGQFDINVVTNGALGGEKETTEGVRLGSIDGALSTLANLTTWVPEGALFDMPFMFRDGDHINTVMTGPIGDEYAALYEAQGFKVLGFITYGARHVISREPITSPADVDGLKMRVLQSQLHIDLWRSLGANPTPIPITEAYTALETGVVDYMDMTMSGYQALKLYEVVPNFTVTGHIWALGAFYVSMNFWDGLTAEQQTVFQATADQVIPFFNEMAAYEQNLSLDFAVSEGATVIRPDLGPWQASMAGFWETAADDVGGIDKIMQIVNTP